MENDINDAKPAYSVRDTVLEILKENGLEDIRYSSDSIVFTCDDVQIAIYVYEEIQSISLVDWHWHEVSKFDIDALSQVYSKVNKINSFGKAKLVWNEEDDDMVYVSTFLDCPFAEETADKEHLLPKLCVALLSYRTVFQPVEQKNENPQ